jgi:hypothetical protein
MAGHHRVPGSLAANGAGRGDVPVGGGSGVLGRLGERVIGEALRVRGVVR